MRQVIYIMFITNNHTSFHLRSKKNLVKYQKVSKCYVHNCLRNFLLVFMFLLTALIVKNSLILAEIYFIFLKTILDQTSKSLDAKFGPQWKDRSSSCQVRKNLALFSNLVGLILSWNLVKNLIVTGIVKKMNFEGTLGKLEAKNCFQRQSWTKYIK